MKKWFLIFLLFVGGATYTQNKDYLTRNRKPLMSIGNIRIGAGFESVNANLGNLVYSEESVEIYKIDAYEFNEIIILNNLYLKFYKCRLVEIAFDFNQQYSDYIGYLQGTSYLDRAAGETVILYNTFTPGVIFKSFLNGYGGDLTIMYIENYSE